MDEKKELEFLFDCASNLIEEAKVNNQTVKDLANNVDKQYKKIDETVYKLKDITQNIKPIIEERVEKHVSLISHRITEKVLEQFDEANEQAKIATEQYKKVASGAAYKFAFLSVFISFIIFGGIYFSYKYYLETEIGEMTHNVERLKKANGKVKLGTCLIDGIEKTCVAVNKDFINRPISSEEGKTYLIVDEE